MCSAPRWRDRRGREKIDFDQSRADDHGHGRGSCGRKEVGIAGDGAGGF